MNENAAAVIDWTASGHKFKVSLAFSATKVCLMLSICLFIFKFNDYILILLQLSLYVAALVLISLKCSLNNCK